MYNQVLLSGCTNPVVPDLSDNALSRSMTAMLEADYSCVGALPAATGYMLMVVDD